VVDTATNGAQNKRGTQIAVQCCALDGTETFRKELDGGCQKEVDFETAQDVCAAHNFRLCTRDEILDRTVKGKGCNFDGYSVWTSSECSVTTAVSMVSMPTVTCFERGPCESGFMDTTDGAYVTRVEGCEVCEGGEFFVSRESCECACEVAGECAVLSSYDNFNVYRFVPQIRFLRFYGRLTEYAAIVYAVAVLVGMWWMTRKVCRMQFGRKKYESLKVYDSETNPLEDYDESAIDEL